MKTDLVVVGSSAGGLACAIVARQRGLDVLVLEKTDRLGGGSAFAAGIIWVPCNRWTSDSAEKAEQYILALSLGAGPESLRKAFIRFAPEAVAYLADRAGIPFAPLRDFPDYRPDLPGWTAYGRTITVENCPGVSLGEWQGRVRSGLPHYPPVSPKDIEDWGRLKNFRSWPFEEIPRRIAEDVRAGRAALVAHLTAAALRVGVRLATQASVSRLLRDDDRIGGVEAVIDGHETPIRSREVVLAGGGFEWNDEMCRDFLRGPHQCAFTPPCNRGDGHRMGMEVGGRLQGMQENGGATLACSLTFGYLAGRHAE